MSTPTFIVGTGRCGSTMLSNMLREHPKVLSLSEFLPSLLTFQTLTRLSALNQSMDSGSGRLSPVSRRR